MTTDDIFAEMEKLFEEVRFDDQGRFRLPVEMRPDRQALTIKEAGELIFDSMSMIFDQLIDCIKRLKEITPNWRFCLKEFFKIYEAKNSDKNLRTFYYLRFRLEARIDYDNL